MLNCKYTAAVPRVVLTPSFVHVENALQLMSPVARLMVESEIEARRGKPLASPGHIVAQYLAERMGALGVKELQPAAHESRLEAGDLIGIEQAFNFRRARKRDRDDYEPVDFYAQLNTDPLIRVQGTLNSARCVNTSAQEHLSGRSRAYILGTVVSVDNSIIEVRPIFAGTRRVQDDDEPEPDIFMRQARRRVYPHQIDQFSAVDWTTSLSWKSIAGTLEFTPEAKLKAAFAEIIGEHHVDKDWGGEQSDLYSSSLFVEGRQMSSAWLLKGPAIFRPMDVAALGKNGDQIVRLSQEPAELLVLQHCHEIRPRVIHLMEAYANDVRNLRRYMIIDGTATYRILHAYGKL